MENNLPNKLRTAKEQKLLCGVYFSFFSLSLCWIGVDAGPISVGVCVTLYECGCDYECGDCECV